MKQSWTRAPVVLGEKEQLPVLSQHQVCGFSSLGSGKLSCGTGASRLLGAAIGEHCYFKTVSQGVYKQTFTAEAACVVL